MITQKGLCEICFPKQWKTISSDMLLDSGYPVYGANGIIGYYSEFNHTERTLLITCRGATCGNLNICEPYSYVNGNAMALDELSADVDIQYLYYYLQHRGFGDVITGSAQPQIVRQSLEKVQIIYPEIERQMEVVILLDRVSSLISLRKQQLAKLDELVKARFVEMFDAKELTQARLGDMCIKITDGTHKTPNYQNEGIKFISAKNIVNGTLDFLDIKYITQNEYQEIQRRCQTEQGDILMSKSGSLGTVALVDTAEPLGLFESLAVIKYNRNLLNGFFLKEQLKSEIAQRNLQKGVKGIAIKHLHLNVISELPIIVPPIEQQNIFAFFVEQIEGLKLTIQQSLDKLEVLKKSLMQEYFGQ